MKKLVAVLLTFLLILTGCNTVEVTKIDDEIKTDAIRFKTEYKKVSKNNIYKYSTYDNIIETLNSKTGVIYLGFKDCFLCKEIVPILDKVSRQKNIRERLYYEFKDIRENNTKEYQDLLNIVSSYIENEDEKETVITAPTVIFVRKGNIVGIYKGVVNNKSEEILNDEDKEKLENKFSSLIDKMFVNETTKGAND